MSSRSRIGLAAGHPANGPLFRAEHRIYSVSRLFPVGQRCYFPDDFLQPLNTPLMLRILDNTLPTSALGPLLIARGFLRILNVRFPNFRYFNPQLPNTLCNRLRHGGEISKYEARLEEQQMLASSPAYSVQTRGIKDCHRSSPCYFSGCVGLAAR